MLLPLVESVLMRDRPAVEVNMPVSVRPFREVVVVQRPDDGQDQREQGQSQHQDAQQ